LGGKWKTARPSAYATPRIAHPTASVACANCILGENEKPRSHPHMPRHASLILLQALHAQTALCQSFTNGSFCEIEFVLRAQIKNLGNFPLAREYRLETAW
jgi:hypothetical protein